MATFQQISSEIRAKLETTSKDILLNEYISQWQNVLKDQSRYPNRKSKQHKDLEKKAKDLQQYIFAVRTSQVNETRGLI